MKTSLTDDNVSYDELLQRLAIDLPSVMTGVVQSSGTVAQPAQGSTLVWDADQQLYVPTILPELLLSGSLPSGFPAIPASGLKMATGQLKTAVPVTAAIGAAGPYVVPITPPADWIAVLGCFGTAWPLTTWTGVEGGVCIGGELGVDVLQAWIGIWNASSAQNFQVSYLLIGY